MKGLIYKWRNLTRDVANELWIARESLSQNGANRRSDQFQVKNLHLKTAPACVDSRLRLSRRRDISILFP